MTWFTEANTQQDIIERAPKLAPAFKEFYDSFWQLSSIPPSVLELCRLRVAQLHQSDYQWQHAQLELSVEQRQSLSQWSKSAVYTQTEKACLAFAEVYCMDPQAITDAQAEAVKSELGDAGLVALIEALGLFYGMTRVSQLWDL
jgi:alkylhydroperoxidase family enzyme